jgi:hypothetical protein
MRYVRQEDVERIEREFFRRLEAAARGEFIEKAAPLVAAASDPFSIKRIWREQWQAIDARERAWLAEELDRCTIEVDEPEDAP